MNNKFKIRHVQFLVTVNTGSIKLYFMIQTKDNQCNQHTVEDVNNDHINLRKTKI